MSAGWRAPATAVTAWWRTRRAPRDAHAVGRRGERLAARRLARAGYRILDRNLRVGRDEADIVALAPDGSTIVIVEVKSRTGAFAPPENAVDRTKQRRLTRLAERLRVSPRYAGRPIRFDAVSVRFHGDGAAPEYRHIVGAF